MNDARELLDAYAQTKPMNRAAHELADALRAVLDNCDFIDCLIGQYKPYEIARMIRAAITIALETKP